MKMTEMEPLCVRRRRVWTVIIASTIQAGLLISSFVGKKNYYTLTQGYSYAFQLLLIINSNQYNFSSGKFQFTNKKKMYLTIGKD